MTREGEGEPKGQPGAFHSHVVQEVGDTVHDMVEELERDLALMVWTLGETVGG